jgi:hypothetical protein
MHFHANLRYGGMNEPAALQQQMTAVRGLHSALEIMPTRFYPVLERILCGLFTKVGTPVSPTL